jgi:uncharacterized membrane protein
MLHRMSDALTDDQIVFEAEVTPHRSLSPRGLKLIIGFVCSVSLVTTTIFWSLGAWPVAGFNGGEILLAMVLLRSHAKSTRQRELLLLSGTALRILRTDATGRATERQLSPGWLNVVLQERPGRVPGLYLASRGQLVEVGATLGEPEKRDLAAALSDAVLRLKNPVFDNPQLRLEAGD